ncbi:MAG: hypothetical protein GDA56_05695 [Hormoscilla sp. GM7CHS1pb]|nr:hypothetical protein [Hormoscilla sp. GM7CHS1pb]
MSEFMNHNQTVELTSNASELALRLQAHPNISARVLYLLYLVENTDNNCETASVAELKIVSELQKLGNDALQDWANSQEKKKLRRVINLLGCAVREKSHYIGIACWELFK